MISKVESKVMSISTKCESQMKDLKGITDEISKRVTNAKENNKKSA